MKKKILFPIFLVMLGALGHHLYLDYFKPWLRHRQSNPVANAEKEIEKFINCLNRE